MGKARVFIACSLDGFIAGPGDDLSWLPPPDESGEDYGYGAFIAETAAILLGRRTYDVVAGFDEWPYGELPVFVATSRALEPVAPTVQGIAGSPAELLATLASSSDGPVYVDGGALIRSFLDADLVDELIVTVVPVILGHGIPLFAGLSASRLLWLRSLTPYPSGLVQVRYAMPRAQPSPEGHPGDAA